MSSLKLVKRMGGLLMVVLVLCLTPSFATAACKDTDGDGYGNGCSAGPDCNNSNPNIHPNAPEICNGVDENCDSFVDLPSPLEVGQACDTGQPGACKLGRIQCTSGALQCVAIQGSTSETCNGIDDNCNGFVDDGPGVDNDNDGVTAVCDCNDSNNAIHPGAVDLCGDGIDQDCNGNVDNKATDSQGKQYCLQIDPIAAVVGTPATVTIRAYYQDGIHSIKLFQENSFQPLEQLCNG